MKQQSSYEMDGESRDLLLFNYLEGNLTEEKALALEAALAADPALIAELESWKESFVVQDFYNTAALEAQLLKPKSPAFSLSGPAAGFLLVFVSSLFSFLSVNEMPSEALLPKAESLSFPAMAVETPAENPEVEKQESKAESAPRAAAIVLAKALASEEGDAVVSNDAAAELPEVASIFPLESASASAEYIQTVDIKRVRQKKALEPKIVSRKEQRRIRKMKEKAQQQKMANEFIKGNRPYVVPLDTKNF